VLWRAQAGTAAPTAFLNVTAGYGVVYASNLPGTGANLICAFDAGTGAKAWQLSGPVWQMYTATPGAVFWSTVTAAGGQFGTGQQVLIASSAAAGTVARYPHLSHGRWQAAASQPFSAYQPHRCGAACHRHQR
jgi:hypothetical protein